MARGGKPLPMPQDWTNRPRLNQAEQALFDEFRRFVRFCGGDPRPPDALAWFELRGTSRSEWPWLAEIFAALSAVEREFAKRD